MRATLSSMTASGTRPSRTACEEPLGPRPAGAGHHEVESAERGFDGGLRGEPVADHDAVEAPLVLEHAVEQRAVRGRRRVDAVAGDAVVGGHDGPDAGVDDGLEGCEVHLAQRALVDAREVLGTLGLGLVADEVLDGCRDALLLDRRDERDREPGREQRVLGEALEVAPADGAALQVHDGREDHVDGLAARLGGHERAEAGLQVDVPRRGGRRGCGQLCGGLVVVARAAHADRAVGDRDGAQAELGDGAERPRGGAGEQRDLLLEGKRGGALDDRLGAGDRPVRVEGAGGGRR